MGIVASCYESLMRFPTDVKLLWECSPKLFTNRFNGFCAPNSFAGVIRDILAHTIV